MPARPARPIARCVPINIISRGTFARFNTSRFSSVDRQVRGPAPDARPSGGGSKSGGTVRSVGLSLPSEFSVAGSPVTQSGTLAVSKAVQAANRVWAGPTTGSDAAPAFRALVATDLPDLSSLYQPLDADLTAVAALLSTGIAVRTAANTWAQRTIAGTANQVNVANGDGVAGNPTLSLPQSIHTSAEPQFARLGLGVPAHASFALDAVGALRFLPGVNQALRILRDTGAPSIAFRNEADTAAYAELGYDHTDNEFFAFLTGTTRAVSLWTNSIKRYLLRANGNMLLGRQQALATTATAGFIYVPTCAGTPTGTPETETGLAPIVINTTNHKLYFYSGGAWRDAGP